MSDMIAGNYAGLQLSIGTEIEAPVERIVYSITSYMDSIGMMPCDSGSAERIVAFVETGKGYSVYDDCAERHDVKAIDGLGQCLSGKFNANAIAVLSSRSDKMIRLYCKGKRRNIYCTSRDIYDGLFSGFRCKGSAVKWKNSIAKGASINELSKAFSMAKHDTYEGYKKIKKILDIDDTLNFGFSSMEEEQLKGVVNLYFCAANRVRQNLFEKALNPFKVKKSLVGNALKNKFYRYSWGY